MQDIAEVIHVTNMTIIYLMYIEVCPFFSFLFSFLTPQEEGRSSKVISWLGVAFNKISNKKVNVWKPPSDLTDHLIFDGIIDYPRCCSFGDSRIKLLLVKSWLPSNSHDVSPSQKFLFELKQLKRMAICKYLKIHKKTKTITDIKTYIYHIWWKVRPNMSAGNIKKNFKCILQLHI